MNQFQNQQPTPEIQVLVGVITDHKIVIGVTSVAGNSIKTNAINPVVTATMTIVVHIVEVGVMVFIIVGKESRIVPEGIEVRGVIRVTLTNSKMPETSTTDQTTGIIVLIIISKFVCRKEKFYRIDLNTFN